jgi:hypothetical protein
MEETDKLPAEEWQTPHEQGSLLFFLEGVRGENGLALPMSLHSRKVGDIQSCTLVHRHFLAGLFYQPELLSKTLNGRF